MSNAPRNFPELVPMSDIKFGGDMTALSGLLGTTQYVVHPVTELKDKALVAGSRNDTNGRVSAIVDFVDGKGLVVVSTKRILVRKW